MEWPGLKQALILSFRKYRYVALILLAGLFLMAIPEKEATTIRETKPEVTQEPTLEQRLEEILSRIKGAGKVQVLLTEDRGEEYLYQTDTDTGNEDFREKTVIISDSGREEQGLLRQTLPPEYLGAIIVCQGGDRPTVKLAIVEAVMDVTGLTSQQITVLKMK